MHKDSYKSQEKNPDAVLKTDRLRFSKIKKPGKTSPELLLLDKHEIKL